MVELSIENENRALVKVGENLISETTDDLKNALEQAMNKGCIFINMDMAGVQYINSSGLGILISYHTKLKDMNGKLQFKNVSESLLDFFQDINLVKEFYLDS